MTRKLSLVALALVVAAACARETTAPSGANPVHDVLITVTVPGHCIFGGCDPPGGGRNTLALVRVLDSGATTAYLAACGQYAALTEQQLVDGEWVLVGPAYSCPANEGPIVLAPGDSLISNWFFAPGRRRLIVGVAGSVNMADVALDASASFDIP